MSERQILSELSVDSRGVGLLARFDAKFALKQDILLERHYMPSFPMGAPGSRSGVSFPGVRLDGPTEPFAFPDQR
jgi:hypothetical protein